ncbi:MAG: hypothetical protein R2932_03025 [Caldilineaceae bacterium]
MASITVQARLYWWRSNARQAPEREVIGKPSKAYFRMVLDDLGIDPAHHRHDR